MDAAQQSLQRHNVRTEIVKHHEDALKEWKHMASLVKDSQVVFNSIDFGDYFDIALGSLCLK